MGESVMRSLAKAETIARERGVALTPVRRRVLELLLRAGRPVGAYDLMAGLKTAAGRTMPPTVYRTLDFLMEQGLVHRIESRNAFVACIDADSPHRCQFVICDRCGRTVESMDDDVALKLSRQAARLGFKVDHQIVEMHGMCANCRESPRSRTGRKRRA